MSETAALNLTLNYYLDYLRTKYGDDWRDSTLNESERMVIMGLRKLCVKL